MTTLGNKNAMKMTKIMICGQETVKLKDEGTAVTILAKNDKLDYNNLQSIFSQYFDVDTPDSFEDCGQLLVRFYEDA